MIESIRSELNELIQIIIIRLPENRGAGEARNAGWDAASQDFVAFLDADDTWHPQKLEIQISWMLANPNYLMTCHESEISHGDRHLNYAAEGIKSQKISLMLMFYRNEISTRTVVVSRKLKRRFPPVARHAEDYQLWLRILLSGTVVMKLYAPLARSYKDDFGVGGLSENLLAMHKGVLRCFEELRRDRLISTGLYYFLVAFELLKYWRRVVLTTVRREL
jgi:glycosyltransferase involved in cell wall biosynthesis